MSHPQYQSSFHSELLSFIISSLTLYRLRERELQLQSDLTTASREINRLRVNIKAAAVGRGERGSSGPAQPALTSASLAALSLRSPPGEPDRDRQH